MATTPENESKSNVLDEIKALIGTPVPLEIKNPEAYLEHLKLKSNPINNLSLTIGELKIPISSPYPVIKMHMRKQNIADDSEQGEKILRLKKRQMQLAANSMAQHRKAYGTIVNAAGVKVEIKSIFDPIRQQLIVLFGRMFTLKEVHEICLTQWKLTVKVQALQDFRRDNQVEINKLIEEHQRTYSDIRLGHKRSRLEELTWLFHERKRIYETTKKADDHRLLLATLAQIKSEAEGDVIRIDGNVDININQSIESHIHNNLMKTIGIKEIVMGRVAAKIGVPAVRVIEALNKSHYRQIIDAEDIEHEVLPNYPSLQNYDFDRIRMMNEQKEHVAAIQKQTDAAVDDTAVTTGNTLRALLLKKLTQKNGDVNFAKNSLSGHFDK